MKSLDAEISWFLFKTNMTSFSAFVCDRNFIKQRCAVEKSYGEVNWLFFIRLLSATRQNNTTVYDLATYVIDCGSSWGNSQTYLSNNLILILILILIRLRLFSFLICFYSLFFSFLNVNLMNDRPCKRFRPITSTRKCLPSTNWATTKSTNNGIVNLFMKYYCIIYCSFDCLTYCNLTYSTLTWLASTWFEWTDEWNWTGRQDGVVNLAFFIGGDGQTGQSQTGGCWNFSNTNRRWRENRPPQQIAIG